MAAGVVEPTCAEAVGAVIDNPDWLRLEGRTVAVLGAGAEMGPLPSLLRWGARVAAVDLPRPELWTRVLGDTSEARRAGCSVPATPGRRRPRPSAPAPTCSPTCPRSPAGRGAARARSSSATTSTPTAPPTSASRTAVDALTTGCSRARDDVALAFLATPTDVFAVPGEAVAQPRAGLRGPAGTAKALRPPAARAVGRAAAAPQLRARRRPRHQRLLVPQQGPNYALAKRLQRWRATVARADGATVSMNVAPPTRTRSVVKNRALAAAYAGAHRFGVEVFEPATSNTLMAALLVHDLHTGVGRASEHPWQDEAYAAAHGGLWRAAYAPRSALGLAALLGAASARP